MIACEHSRVRQIITPYIFESNHLEHYIRIKKENEEVKFHKS